MPTKDTQTRLTGLWLNTTPGGKRVLNGKVSVSELVAAVKTTGVGSDGSVALTIWLNKSEEKRNANSPDANLVIDRPYEPSAQVDDVPADDIPF